MLYVSQRMGVYMFMVYFIYRKCVDIILSHHLQLKVQCDFTYALKALKVAKLITTII